MDESFFSYIFLQKALGMALIGGGACGVAGVFVVLWRIGFIGICISHAAFAGALVGLWAGVPPMVGGLAGSLGAASLIGPLADKPAFTPDAAVGVIFSVMLSLAMLALGLLPGSRIEGLSFIWGSLLTVTDLDLILMSGAALFLGIFIFLFFKEISATISQRRSAEAAGVPVRTVFYACILLLGFIIAIALKAIGGLLIYSLIITPAITALQLTYSLKWMFVLAGAFGALSSAFGLWLSYYWALPSGAAIVLTATSFMALSLFFSPKRKRES